jgi:hypothetical protein
MRDGYMAGQVQPDVEGDVSVTGLEEQ